MAVYFFYGEEDFNIDLELEEMKSRLNQDFLAMNYKVFDNPEFTNLITVLRTPPMMFGESLIIINSEKYLLSQKKYFDDNELTDIEEALNNLPTSLNVVFVVRLPREENKKLDTRKKLYKILSKHTSKEFLAYKTYKTAEIASWVKQRARIKGITIKEDALELLIEQIGNNLRQHDCELEKLKLMAYPEKNITKEMVSEIAISNQDIFNITELIVKNSKDRALLEFQKLTSKKHPLEILSAMQTILRKWIIIKTKVSELSLIELAKLTGQHEYAIKQTVTKLKNTKASDLVKLKQNLYEVECKIKTAESVDMISEVEIAIIR